MTQPSAHPSFEALRNEHIESLNLDVEQYQHRATGAMHYHLAAENTENVEACAHWVIGMFHPLRNGWLKKDRDWGISTVRQRALLRLDILAQTTEEFGHLEAIGATVRDMVEKLREFWPDVEEMPYYPAFR